MQNLSIWIQNFKEKKKIWNKTFGSMECVNINLDFFSIVYRNICYSNVILPRNFCNGILFGQSFRRFFYIFILIYSDDNNNDIDTYYWN